MTTQKPEVGTDDKVNVGPGATDSSGDRIVMVYATFPDAAAGETVGRALVEAGLVACANIVPGVLSIYRWQGAIQRDSEVIVLLKTRAALAEHVVAEVKRRHSYATPAVLVFEPAGGSADFMAWIVGETVRTEGTSNDKS